MDNLAEDPVAGENRLGGGVLAAELEPSRLSYETGDPPVLEGDESVTVGNHNL